MVVDAEILNASRTAVDKAEPVGLAGSDSELAVAGIRVAWRTRSKAAIERHSAINYGIVGSLRL